MATIEINDKEIKVTEGKVKIIKFKDFKEGEILINGVPREEFKFPE